MCSVPSNPKYFYQAGIVVAGIGCGQRNVPAFYADVSAYKDWIDKKISDLGLDTRSYTF